MSVTQFNLNLSQLLLYGKRRDQVADETIKLVWWIAHSDLTKGTLPRFVLRLCIWLL